MRRFLEGLDRRSLGFYGEVEGGTDPKSRAKNVGIMRTGAAERATIAQRMPALCAQLVAQFADPTPASAYAGIDVPVLLLSGARPRACTRRIAQFLARTLPRAEWRQLDGACHMGLGSHPEAVDREIEDFLARRAPVGYRDPEPASAYRLVALDDQERRTPVNLFAAFGKYLSVTPSASGLNNEHHQPREA